MKFKQSLSSVLTCKRTFWCSNFLCTSYVFNWTKILVSDYFSQNFHFILVGFGILFTILKSKWNENCFYQFSHTKPQCANFIIFLILETEEKKMELEISKSFHDCRFHLKLEKFHDLYCIKSLHHTKQYEM